jgi:DNA primase
MNQSEEIKGKLDIVDVLGEYISLKAAGSNFRANCPFHNEKTPSFMVSPEKQIWHCFGCSKGGDVFSFVMEMEGLNFTETLRLLAPKAGVVLKREDIETSSKRNNLLDIMVLAQEYYQREMLHNDKIKNYLKERGLDGETVKTWKIGYSPNSWDDLFNYLRNKKYSAEEIFLAGLSVKKEGGASYYNRFRDRIMFPINDVSGNIVAFTARINPDNNNPEMEKMGKYINSPQTAIYDKSRILFALDKAKQEIKAQDLVIVVEGQMDAITCHQFGYKNVVASSGTALTFEHVKLIRRYTNNIALAFDADNAGQIAADRGIKEAMAQELNIKIIVIPSGKDPDDCLHQAPDEWEKAVKEARPMMEYYFDKVFEKLDPAKVEDKRQAVKILVEMIAKFSNKVEIDHWLRKLSQKIEIAEEVLRETLKNVLNQAKGEVVLTPKKEVNFGLKTNEPRTEKMSSLLLAILLKYPEFLEYSANNIEMDYISGPTNRSFYNILIMYYNNHKGLEYEDFKAYLGEKEVSHVKLLDTLVFLAEKDFSGVEMDQIKTEIIKIILVLKQYYYKSKMKEAEREITQAEISGDSTKISQALQDLKIWSEKIKSINIDYEK